MGNPLLVFWHRMLLEPPSRRRPSYVDLVEEPTAATAPIFLVLRRMRAPLIVLILIFAISVIGLTLMPGQDASGQPHRLGFFDAFYFMSYTATTIGYGEIPYPFSTAQRMWVTFSIYLAVIGWAYAIGMLLALVQDHTFRQAVATQRFRRGVARLPEPFWLVAGYGRTGQLVGRALDGVGRRFVALDLDPERIDVLDLDALRADVPALPADARVPAHLVRAGLLHERCEGVLALTDDDDANLAVVMTAALLRPELPVIARTASAVVAQRMGAFAGPTIVVNPYDDFGDHLAVALRAPSAYQLRQWLTSPPGSRLPPLLDVPPPGPWVVVGDTPFSAEVVADLRRHGLAVQVVTPDDDSAVVLPPHLGGAVGVVAATTTDVLNLAVIEQARRDDPGVFVIAQQASPANRALYEASGADLVLVVAEVVAHEVLARVTSPVLWQFLRELSARGEQVAASLRDALVAASGDQVPDVWSLTMTGDDAPALVPHLWGSTVRLQDVLRSPADRDEGVAAVPLLLRREGLTLLLPDGDVTLLPGDDLLLAGRPAARRQLATTMLDEATAGYVLTGAATPTTWIGRALTRR
jgi:voltage-gated potassium channel Kch